MEWKGSTGKVSVKYRRRALKSFEVSNWCEGFGPRVVSLSLFPTNVVPDKWQSTSQGASLGFLHGVDSWQRATSLVLLVIGNVFQKCTSTALTTKWRNDQNSAKLVILTVLKGAGGVGWGAGGGEEGSSRDRQGSKHSQGLFFCYISLLQASSKLKWQMARRCVSMLATSALPWLVRFLKSGSIRQRGDVNHRHYIAILFP